MRENDHNLSVVGNIII